MAVSSGVLSIDENVVRKVEILKALANPTRLRIVQFIGGGPQTVTAIVDALELRQSLISHELAVLRGKGIVSGTRDGYCVRYSLVDPTAILVLRCFGEKECPSCQPSRRRGRRDPVR